MDLEPGKEYCIQFKPSFSAALGGNQEQTFTGKLTGEDRGYLTFRNQDTFLGPIPEIWITDWREV